MKTKAEVLKETAYPKLVNAVIRKIGIDSVEDVNNHGIDGGFNGFVYYCDTVRFFNRNKADIMSMAESMAKEFGQSAIEMIQGFNCLGNGQGKERKSDYSLDEIARAIYSGKGESADIIKNAMAWFAAEEVCRMFEN